MRKVYMLLLVLWGCGEMSGQMEREFMVTARGETGEIILVVDSMQWNGDVGESLRDVFVQPIPGLPQDEQMFRLSKVSPLKLNSTLKSATNMVFVMSLDRYTEESDALRSLFTNQSLKKIKEDSSLFMSLRRDEFALGQVVMFLYAQDEGQLVQKLNENKDLIQNTFEKIEQERLVKKLSVKRSGEIEKAIAEKHPYSLVVPFGWDLARNDENFIWLRQLEAQSELDIFVHYEPYTSAEVFKDVPAYRDRITSTYLRDGENSDQYITRQVFEGVQDVFLDEINFQDRYAVEARGLWKITDNTAGGPYVSYTFVDEARQLLYYIEGYVYAPGGKKKHHLRKVDAILSTFSLQPPK